MAAGASPAQHRRARRAGWTCPVAPTCAAVRRCCSGSGTARTWWGATVVLAEELAFDLRKASPRLPKQGIPEGRTAGERLRVLAGAGVRRSATPARDNEVKARDRVEAEMQVILEKDFAGYFIIVHDIVAVRPQRADPLPGAGIRGELRGLLRAGDHRRSTRSTTTCRSSGSSPSTAEEEPDIDVDFDSDRREEVIQWVYDTYGRRNAAQVCERDQLPPDGWRCATRPRRSGFSPGQQDAWSKSIDGWGDVEVEKGAGHPRPGASALAEELMGAPRHLGIHSGGMVLTERPIGEVVPDRAGPDGEPHRPAVGQGRLRVDGAGEVRPARASGCSARSHHMMRPGRGAHRRVAGRLETLPKEEPGGLRHALPGGLDRRLPGRVARPDRHAAAAASRAPSTTSPSRSR